MNHGDLGVDNFTLGTDGQKDAGHAHYIESGPHLMLMPKDPSSLEGQSTDFTTGAPYVMFKGTPYAHLMIPLVNMLVPGLPTLNLSDPSRGIR